MGPLLEGLVKLQSIENQLRAVKAKLNRCRRSVVIQENQIRSLQSALEAKKEEAQLTKIQSDRLELELRSREEEIAKYRAALNIAKTNKEYAAVLTQLNTNKADNSKLETQILDLMKDVEADEEECKQITAQIEEQKKILDDKRRDSESQSVKLEADIEEIQKKWDEIASEVLPENLDIFRRVADTYDGEAIASVDVQEGASTGYSCGGCFMGITAEIVNILMTKDEILRCPNCTRILVYEKAAEI